jgi:Major tropism determinant N-terminal domain
MNKTPAVQFLRRRGSAPDHANFIGAKSEMTFDTTLLTMRVHDGQNAGGYVLVRRELDGSLNLGSYKFSADGTTMSCTNMGSNFRIVNGQSQILDSALNKWRVLGCLNGVLTLSDPIS